jgi:hypothetical protein
VAPRPPTSPPGAHAISNVARVLEELDLSSLPSDRGDWVRTFLALALADAGNPKAVARTALEGLSNHLTQYRAVVTRYAAELNENA